MDLTKHLPSHPTEEVLEEYVFHHLPEALTAQVEEHLLICDSCQEAVQKIDEFASAMKACVSARGPASDPARSGGLDSPWRAMQGWSSSKTGVASILALTLLVLLVLRKPPDEHSAPVAVTLSSVRGAEALAVAPAGRQLELRIEAPDLIQAHEYLVQLVDAAGGQVWKGTVRYAGGKLIAQMPKQLKNGVYWVRLSDTAGTALREFGMSVK